MHEWFLLSAALNIVVGILSGIFVLRSNPKSSLNQSFGILCIFMTIWASGYFLSIAPNDPETSELSFKAQYTGLLFIAVAHFYFVARFLRVYQKYKLWVYLGALINLMFLPFLWTSPIFFQSIIFKIDIGYWPTLGPLFHCWVLVWLGYWFWGFNLLRTHYLRAQGLRRAHIGYLLLGDLITGFLLTANFFYFYDINIPPTLNVFVSVQMLFFAYLILRFKHYELQGFIITLLQKVISIILVTGLSLIILNLLTKHELTSVSPFLWIILTFSLLGGYLLMQTLISRTRVSRLLHLQNHQNFSEINQQFREYKLFYNSITDLNQAISAFFVKKGGITESQVSLSEDLPPKVLKEISTHVQTHKALITENLRFHEEIKHQKHPLMKSAEALGEVVIPLYFKEKIVAFWTLGFKKNKNLYFQQELDVLTQTSRYINLYIALIFYNKNLKDEVDEKTKALKTRNLQLKSSFDKLKELDQAKDDFISIASHELRTPMTIIKGYADFLLDNNFGKLNIQQSDFAQNIYDSTESLIHLTNNMLDINKIEAGNFEVNLSKVELKKWLKKLVNEFKIICQEKDIKLSFTATKVKTEAIEIDAEKIGQVTKNILSNAYKMTPEGGTIKVKLEEQSDQFLVSISDTGPGIPKDKQGLIFEKFQQADSGMKKQIKGSGLGLNIVRKIIENFGGKVWVESAGIPGKGATFFFAFLKK